MSPEAQAGLVGAIGIVAIRLVVTDAFLAYVKPGMRIPLLAAGSILVLLGGATMIKAFVTGTERSHAGHGHEDHGHGASRVAYLLVLPLVTIVLVAPAPLGAYAAAREGGDRAAAQVVPEVRGVAYPGLPAPRDGAVDLRIGEFLERVYYDEARSLEGTPVRLIGFAVNIPERDDAFLLSRFVISCCAADAFPMQAIVKTPAVPANDTWLEVVGTWDPDDLGLGQAGRSATLISTSVQPIDPPANPYE
jgi:uncharacterized repeat protein (TIGR03943 family)